MSNQEENLKAATAQQTLSLRHQRNWMGLHQAAKAADEDDWTGVAVNLALGSDRELLKEAADLADRYRESIKTEEGLTEDQDHPLRVELDAFADKLDAALTAIKTKDKELRDGGEGDWGGSPLGG